MLREGDGGGGWYRVFNDTLRRNGNPRHQAPGGPRLGPRPTSNTLQGKRKRKQRMRRQLCWFKDQVLIPPLPPGEAALSSKRTGEKPSTVVALGPITSAVHRRFTWRSHRMTLNPLLRWETHRAARSPTPNPDLSRSRPQNASRSIYPTEHPLLGTVEEKGEREGEGNGQSRRWMVDSSQRHASLPFRRSLTLLSCSPVPATSHYCSKPPPPVH